MHNLFVTDTTPTVYKWFNGYGWHVAFKIKIMCN